MEILDFLANAFVIGGWRAALALGGLLGAVVLLMRWFRPLPWPRSDEGEVLTAAALAALLGPAPARTARFDAERKFFLGGAMRTCPFLDCGHRVRDDVFCCRRHWLTLKKPERDEVWAAYHAYTAGRIGAEELRRRQQSVLGTRGVA